MFSKLFKPSTVKAEPTEQLKEINNIEAENVNLKALVQKLQQENETLKESSRQQEGVIHRLDDSVNQLMEEIEQQNGIIEKPSLQIHFSPRQNFVAVVDGKIQI
jgi:predicted nuclease with TOPRIM domain